MERLGHVGVYAGEEEHERSVPRSKFFFQHSLRERRSRVCPRKVSICAPSPAPSSRTFLFTSSDIYMALMFAYPGLYSICGAVKNTYRTIRRSILCRVYTGRYTQRGCTRDRGFSLSLSIGDCAVSGAEKRGLTARLTGVLCSLFQIFLCLDISLSSREDGLCTDGASSRPNHQRASFWLSRWSWIR